MQAKRKHYLKCLENNGGYLIQIVITKLFLFLCSNKEKFFVRYP